MKRTSHLQAVDLHALFAVGEYQTTHLGPRAPILVDQRTFDLWAYQAKRGEIGHALDQGSGRPVMSRTTRLRQAGLKLSELWVRPDGLYSHHTAGTCLAAREDLKHLKPLHPGVWADLVWRPPQEAVTAPAELRPDAERRHALMGRDDIDSPSFALSALGDSPSPHLRHILLSHHAPPKDVWEIFLRWHPSLEDLLDPEHHVRSYSALVDAQLAQQHTLLACHAEASEMMECKGAEVIVLTNAEMSAYSGSRKNQTYATLQRPHLRSCSRQDNGGLPLSYNYVGLEALLEAFGVTKLAETSGLGQRLWQAIWHSALLREAKHQHHVQLRYYLNHSLERLGVRDHATVLQLFDQEGHLLHVYATDPNGHDFYRREPLLCNPGRAKLPEWSGSFADRLIYTCFDGLSLGGRGGSAVDFLELHPEATP